MAAPGQTVCVQDLSGTRTPLSSKWSGNAGIEYRQPVGNLELTGRVDATFRSNYNASPNNDLTLGPQKGFVLLAARPTLGDGKSTPLNDRKSTAHRMPTSTCKKNTNKQTTSASNN